MLSQHKQQGGQGQSTTTKSAQADTMSSVTAQPVVEKSNSPPIPPPKMEPSGGTFDQQQQQPQSTTSIANNLENVVITDALSDVRVRYHINPKEIGHGHYGVVRKCMDRQTKEWLAIKSIRKSKVGRVDVLKREIDILKEVHHPNIIQLVEVHEDEKYLHLITGTRFFNFFLNFQKKKSYVHNYLSMLPLTIHPNSPSLPSSRSR